MAVSEWSLFKRVKSANQTNAARKFLGHKSAQHMTPLHATARHFIRKCPQSSIVAVYLSNLCSLIPYMRVVY